MNRFEIRWRNFRSFEDTDWLDIRPVTILIGGNNTGKTSIIAPLLLMKQTLEAEDESVPLITRGKLFNVGRFRDLVHDHDEEAAVTLHLGFHTHPHSGRDLKVVGEYPPGAVELTFEKDPSSEAIQLQRYRVRDIYKRLFMTRGLLKTGRYSLHGVERVLSRDEKDVRAGAGGDRRVDKKIKRAIREAQPHNFLFQAGDIIRSALPKPSDARDAEIEFSGFTSLYLSIIEIVNSQTTGLLDEISYVGPLRRRPDRFYEISGEPPADVGTEGQSAPELLYRNAGGELFQHVNEWLSRFHDATTLECVDVGRAIGAFSLMLRRKSGTEINLADAGFGISQILPLIVQGYVGSARSILISEQPEIHLNPRLQALLADLFADMANRGRGVIVETHSEHLLLRLRRLIAEGVIEADDVAVYYIERDGSNSTVRSIPITDNGHIPADRWPRGFFEDSLRESLGLAGAQAKRKSDG